MAKHHEEVAPFGVHVVTFIGSTDPASDPDNFVTAGKLWIDTTSGFVLKKRNAGNTDWDTLSKSALAALDIDTDATLAANSNSKVPTQAAVKGYVDGKVAGLSWKQAVRVATTAAGTLATDFENGDTVDGVVLATGDRVLIKNQASGAENGLYVVAASGAPTRATDADAGAELVNASVYVSEGTVNADTQWTCTTNAPITVDSTSLAFAQLTSGGDGIPEVLIDALGDLVYGSADDTAARLAGNTTTTKKFLTQTGDGANSAAPGWNTIAAGDVPDLSATYGTVAQAKAEVLMFAVSDETTAITTGTAKLTFRMPFAMTLTGVRASLTTASSSGTPTVDINEGGVSILSTKLTIDASEKTSTTAAAAAVISDASLADDAEMTIDIDVAGTGAAGLKVYLIGTRA